MKVISAVFCLMLMTSPAYGGNKEQPLGMTCQDYSWGDVEVLVQPYLDDSLYTALVMQGQSAHYKISVAASQAMDDSLPEVIRRILQDLIQADC